MGIGEDQGYLTELAREQGVEQRTRFLGHVDAEDLPRWYNAADIFAMPNRVVNNDTEGFGMVYIEAAACGKAALALLDPPLEPPLLPLLATTAAGPGWWRSLVSR